MGALAKSYFLGVINAEHRSHVMTRILNAIRHLAGPAEPESDDALRRMIHQLEAENQVLREKLAWRGPWMF